VRVPLRRGLWLSLVVRDEEAGVRISTASKIWNIAYPSTNPDKQNPFVEKPIVRGLSRNSRNALQVAPACREAAAASTARSVAFGSIHLGHFNSLLLGGSSGMDFAVLPIIQHFMSTQQPDPLFRSLRLASLAAALLGMLSLSASAKNKGDIGSPKPEGKSSQQGDTWTVTGGGADIFGVSDQFHFMSMSASGNSVLSTKVMSVGEPGAHEWAKGGLMIRADESVGAPHACIAVSHSGNIAFLTRTTPGGDTRTEKVSKKSFPIFLRLERKGNDFTGSYSEDGKTWLMVGKTMTVPMKPSTIAGLAVSSHSDGAACTAVFSNFLIRR
jgi:regulation of enolase protein 1 (concanavalin A-like superfamily)